MKYVEIDIIVSKSLEKCSLKNFFYKVIPVS